MTSALEHRSVKEFSSLNLSFDPITDRQGNVSGVYLTRWSKRSFSATVGREQGYATRCKETCEPEQLECSKSFHRSSYKLRIVSISLQLVRVTRGTGSRKDTVSASLAIDMSVIGDESASRGCVISRRPPRRASTLLWKKGINPKANTASAH